MQLGLDEINAAGGIHGRHIRIVRKDDRASINDGILVAQQLAQNTHVMAVIGHHESYVSVPASAIYDAAGLVMIVPSSTASELTSHRFKRLFRTTFTSRQLGRRLADVAAGRGLERIAILYIRSPVGKEVANGFEERAVDRGVSVIARRSFDPSIDVTEQMLEQTAIDWKNRDLDAMLVAGAGGVAARFLIEARKQGITAPVLGDDALGTHQFIATGGPAVDGAIIATNFMPSDRRPEAQQFVQAFRRRFGVMPDASAALAFNAIKLLAYAMNRAGSPVPDSVASTLHAIRDWPGVTGHLTFDSAGDLIEAPVHLVVVKGGAFEDLPSPATERAALR